MNRTAWQILTCWLVLILIVSGRLPRATAVDVVFEGTSSSTDFSDAGSDLGNEGYWFANFNREGGINTAPPEENAIDATPAYVSIEFGEGVDSAGGWGGYADLTLPDGTVGNSGALEINNEGASDRLAGSQHEYLTLTFGAGAPANLLLGLVADSSDGLQFSNSALLANGVSTGALTNDLGPDIHTFRLSNISAGDTVRIDGLASTDNTVSHLGGFLLDVVIPEPSTGILFALLCGYLGGRYFVKRRRD